MRRFDARSVLYSSSILTNPLVASDDTFLADSTPYLLGSAGTIVFDITILTQARLYRKRRRKTHTEEDEAGLLANPH